MGFSAVATVACLEAPVNQVHDFPTFSRRAALQQLRHYCSVHWPAAPTALQLALLGLLRLPGG